MGGFNLHMVVSWQHHPHGPDQSHHCDLALHSISKHLLGTHFAKHLDYK